MQKYFRTRENRNFSTVKSTEQRIFNFSLVEVLMMAGMAALQVLVVRFFFQGARKGESKKGQVVETVADEFRIRVDTDQSMRKNIRDMSTTITRSRATVPETNQRTQRCTTVVLVHLLRPVSKPNSACVLQVRLQAVKSERLSGAMPLCRLASSSSRASAARAQVKPTRSPRPVVQDSGCVAPLRHIQPRVATESKISEYCRYR